MALPYTTQAGKLAYQEATALWKAINFRAGDFKALRGLKSSIGEIKTIKTGLRAAQNQISSNYRKLEFDIGKTKKAGELVSDKLKIQDKLLDQIKRGAFKEINPSWGARLNAFLNVLNAGFSTFMVLKNEEIQALNIESERVQAAAVQDAFTRSINNSIQIKTDRKLIEQLKQSDQKTRDRVYAIEKESITFRQKINDITYEVREGRRKVEATISTQIQNANTKIQDLTNKFNTALGNTATNAQNTIQSAINKLQQQVAELQRPSTQNSEVSRLQTKIETLTKTVDNVPTALQKVLDISQDTTKRLVEASTKPLIESDRRWGVTITPATVTPATINYSSGGIVVPNLARITPATVRYSDFSTSDLGLQIKVQQERELDALERQIAATNSGLSSSYQQIAQAKATADAALKEARIKGVPVNTIEIENRIREQEAKLNTGLNTVNTRIGNIERVNEQSNRKLDQILPKLDSIIPTIAGIPLIAARATTDMIKPSIPTPETIANATATGMCRSLQNGCGRNAIDDAIGNINQHNTSNTGSVLDALNTGANAAQLTLLNTINGKLGDALPGGIGGKLSRLSSWLHLDRALNLLTFAATVHNAFQLSNDIAVTLGSALSNVLQLIGIKNDDGSSLDIGQIINSSVENFVKGIIGAENYQQMSQTFAKANRIYQASVNVLNSFQGLSSIILTGLEMTAGKVAKIGNALRKSGEVLESAYGWMNPQPKFNRVTQLLETLQNGASTIQMVTQAPLDVINATTELTNATTELTNAIKEDGNSTNKGKESPEPDQLTATAATAKLASAGLDMIDLDLEADE